MALSVVLPVYAEEVQNTEETVIDEESGFSDNSSISEQTSDETVVNSMLKESKEKEAVLSAEGLSEDAGISLLALSGPTSVNIGTSITLTGAGQEYPEHSWSYTSQNGGKVLIYSDLNTASVFGIKSGTVVVNHQYNAGKTWRSETYTVTVNNTYDKIEAKIYLRYSNEVPSNINQDSAASEFGPSGNNEPYVTVTVDLSKVAALADVYFSGNYMYYSIDSDSDWMISGKTRKENVENFWDTVIWPAIDADDQQAIKDILGTTGVDGKSTFVGYVLKIESDNWHIDGVLRIEPPVYVVELYDYTKASVPCVFAISDNNTTLPGVAYANFKANLESYLGGDAGSYTYITEEDDNIVVTYTKGGNTYQTTVMPRSDASASYHVYPAQGKFAYRTVSTSYFLSQMKITETKIVYSLDPDEGKLYITGEKKWDDDGDAKGLRPSAVTVNLYADGVKIDSQTATAENNWKYSFDISDRPVLNSDGEPFVYTVGEEAVTYYTEVVSEHVDPTVTFTYPSASDEWTRHTSCSNLDIPVSTNPEALTLVIAKVTGNAAPIVVWSAEPLTEAERAVIKNTIDSNLNPLSGYSQIYYFSGYGTLAASGISALSHLNMTVTEDMISFRGKNEWSMVYQGTFSRGSSTATESSITNKLSVANLTISKSVVGEAANTDEHFVFTLTSSGLNGTYAVEYTGIDGCSEAHASAITFAEGSAELSLKHGETAIVKGLPVGKTITVEESDNSYSTTVSVNGASAVNGKSGNVIIANAADNSIGFVNTYPLVPQTGFAMDVLPYIILLGVVAVGAGTFVFLRYRHRKGDAGNADIWNK